MSEAESMDHKSAKWSSQELVKMRKTVVKRLNKMSSEARKWKFTCDDCSAASTCAWVFDPYNTDGDCIAEK